MMIKSKLILIVIVILLISGCKSTWYNLAFKHIGAYEEKASLASFKKTDSEVVFIEMVHLATKELYDDVGVHIDSLIERNYVFLLEGVKRHNTNDTILRKFRKVTGVPITESSNAELIDSIIALKNIKLKKRLIDQPEFHEFGLDSSNSKNLDASFEELVTYYEDKYGEIILEPCDYESTDGILTECRDKIDKDKYEELVLNYRNKLLIDEILNRPPYSKIAIIYGARHLEGIRDALIANGYVEISNSE